MSTVEVSRTPITDRAVAALHQRTQQLRTVGNQLTNVFSENVRSAFVAATNEFSITQQEMLHKSNDLRQPVLTLETEQSTDMQSDNISDEQ